MMPFAFNTMYAADSPTPAFGARPPQASISQSNGSNFAISGVFFNQPTSAEYLALQNYVNVSITDCDFDTFPVAIGSGRRCIYLLSCSGTLTIQRCRARLVPHNFLQMDKSHMAGTVSQNRIRGTTSNSEDLVSVFQSGGVDATHRLVITDNHLDGNDPTTGTPNYTSGSGSGIQIGDVAQDAGTGFVDCTLNTMLNPGQDGIGIAGGNDVKIDGNQIFSIQTPTSNVGLSIWMNGGALLCQNMESSNNRINWKNSAGANNSFFNGGNCGTIAGSGNAFDDASLAAASLVVVL